MKKGVQILKIDEEVKRKCKLKGKILGLALKIRHKKTCPSYAKNLLADFIDFMGYPQEDPVDAVCLDCGEWKRDYLISGGKI